MPVTARLSRDFYEKFGDRLVNELVDLMNSVDLSYRQDVAQINEANVSRFNATLDARAAALRLEIEAVRAEMRQGFADLRAEMHKELADVRAEMRQGFAEVDRRFAAVDLRFVQLETRFAEFEARMLKWMFVFWITTLGTLIALK